MSRSIRSLALAGLLWVTTAATCGALSPLAEMLLERVGGLEDGQHYVVDSTDQVVGVSIVGTSGELSIVTVDVDGFPLFLAQVEREEIVKRSFVYYLADDCTGDPWSLDQPRNLIPTARFDGATLDMYVGDDEGAPELMTLCSYRDWIECRDLTPCVSRIAQPALKVFDADHFTPPFRVVRASDLVGG